MKKGTDRGMRRWRAVALLAAGLAIGVTMTATPAMSHVGGTVSHLWNTHIKPKADARYVKKSAIKTIQGNYAGGAVAASANDDAWENISWGFDLGTAPQEHYIPDGGVPPAECPGTAENPQAAPGHLCVFESFSVNLASVTIFTGTTGGTGQASRWGAGLWIQSTAAGNFFSYGTWAVTAGAGVTPARADSTTSRAGS
jgi:hypothetical protein